MSLKNNYPHPYIAREGHPYIILVLLIAWGVFLLDCQILDLLMYLFTALIVQFFRDPPRNLADENEASVVAPADGKVIVVQKTVDPYRRQEALQISIFMNIFNVHSNRMPLAGKVQEVRYFPGNFVNASLDKASKENERNAVLFQTPQGEEVTVVQIAGLIARRILCYCRAGDEVSRGERYGFIRFGSRVDLYLPVDARPCVVIGDKVRATSSVLAYLKASSEE
ncbi:MAG: phosphatidylserine decarboxylase [Neisseriaceae bacterium]